MNWFIYKLLIFVFEQEELPEGKTSHMNRDFHVWFWELCVMILLSDSIIVYASSNEINSDIYLSLFIL